MEDKIKKLIKLIEQLTELLKQVIKLVVQLDNLMIRIISVVGWILILIKLFT